ncbi:MAG TPA: HAD family hydrolase [Thermotogota bacterium]|nr:HAD family hydrolase [Thermotogota bacterium]HRW93180.1 HAD family hydrolase [Thermotogota bacterium]
MEQKYRLFITDLDGTLLDDAKEISPANREAIAGLLRRGIPATIFTGRNFHSAKDIVEDLQLSVPVVFQNGALIMNLGTGEVFRQVGLRSEVAREILAKALQMELHPLVYSGFLDLPDIMAQSEFWGGMPFGRYVEANRFRLRMVADLSHEMQQRDHIAQMAIVGRQEELQRLSDFSQGTFSEQISVVMSSVIEGVGFLEFFGPKVSKGIAFERLLDLFGVPAENTVFIGDNFNDVPLMERVGMPVAMANAPAEVKAICKLVVSDNNSDGVAQAISRLF